MYIHIKMTNNEHKNLNDRILALGMYPGLKCQPSCGGGAVIYCINSWGASSKIKKKRSWSERWDSDLQGVIEVHGNYLYTGGGAKCSKLIYGTYIEVEKKNTIRYTDFHFVYLLCCYLCTIRPVNFIDMCLTSS